nr:hypothetical protein [Tanacetum cinerariifolium]
MKFWNGAMEATAEMVDKEVIKVLLRCLVGLLVISWRCLRCLRGGCYSYGKSKVHIEVLLVLWEDRLLILDGSLPLSRNNGHMLTPDAPPGTPSALKYFTCAYTGSPHLDTFSIELLYMCLHRMPPPGHPQH